MANSNVTVYRNRGGNISVNAPIKNTAFLDMKDCIEMITPADSETEWWS